MPKKFITKNSQETKSLGKQIAKNLKAGDLIALYGELGSGKTTFVKGIVSGLGGQENQVTSPTFTLINEYSGRLPVYHIDLYRVGKQSELESLNLREYLYGDGVSLVEWFEFLPAHEVDEYLEIRIGHGGGNRRELTFIAHGGRYDALLARLFSRRQSAKAKGKVQNAE